MPPRAREDATKAARERFFGALAGLGPLTAASRQAFEPLLVPRSFAAGETLLRGGQMASHCFFIDTGLVREFYTASDGSEHTRTFVHEGQLTGSLLDLISQRPAVTFIEALEPTVTLAFSYAKFDALCERFAELQRAARHIAEALYVRKARREHDMLALTAGQRYEQWLRDHPGLDSRVQRRHLASYLGVSPEHLSRLRRT